MRIFALFMFIPAAIRLNAQQNNDEYEAAAYYFLTTIQIA